MIGRVKHIFKIYREPIVYLIFGGMSFVLNIFLYYWCAQILRCPYLMANAIAWASSVVFSFVTNKLFVFENQMCNKSDWLKQGMQFVVSRIFTGVLDMVGMYIFIDKMNISQMISKVMVNIVVIVANYIISKIWIFAETDG